MIRLTTGMLGCLCGSLSGNRACVTVGRRYMDSCVDVYIHGWLPIDYVEAAIDWSSPASQRAAAPKFSFFFFFSFLRSNNGHLPLTSFHFFTRRVPIPCGNWNLNIFHRRRDRMHLFNISTAKKEKDLEDFFWSIRRPRNLTRRAACKRLWNEFRFHATSIGYIFLACWTIRVIFR